MKRKTGFTLLELVVVIIIIAVLASLGFSQYTKVVEKMRSAEAKSNLGLLRKLQLGYYMENGVYASIEVDDLGTGLPTGYGSGCNNTNFYFKYIYLSGGDGRAARCTSGGKAPNVDASGQYDIHLSIDGVFTSSPPGYL